MVGARGKPGDCLSTLSPCSDTGCADLPLTSMMIGCPVDIGDARVMVSRLATENLGTPSRDRTACVQIWGEEHSDRIS